MRISDWSSDVCSSDLLVRGLGGVEALLALGEVDERLVDRGVVGLDGEALELQLVDLGLGHFGKRFQLDRDDRILAGLAAFLEQIGRASCRERGCQYV